MAKVTAVVEIAEIEGDTKATLPVAVHEGAVLNAAFAAKVIVTDVAADNPVMLPLLLVEPVVTVPAEAVGIVPASCKSPPIGIVKTSVAPLFITKWIAFEDAVPRVKSPLLDQTYPVFARLNEPVPV